MRHPDEGTIHAWLDGALAPDEGAALEAHVAACAACAAAVAEARGLVAASSRILSALDDVPAGVVAGVVPAAPDEGLPVIPLRPAAPRRRVATPAVRAAAALLLVAGIGGALMVNDARRDAEVVVQASSKSAAGLQAAPEAMVAAAEAPAAPTAAAPAPIAATSTEREGLVTATGAATDARQVVAAGTDAARTDAAADVATRITAAAPSRPTAMAALAQAERTASPEAPPPAVLRDATPLETRRMAAAPSRGAVVGQTGAGAGAPLAAVAPQAAAASMEEASRAVERSRASRREADEAKDAAPPSAANAAEAPSDVGSSAARRASAFAGCWVVSAPALLAGRPDAPTRVRLTAEPAPGDTSAWVARALPRGDPGTWTRGRGDAVTITLPAWPRDVRLVLRAADGALYGDGTTLRRAGC